jgi:hypothetical protein
MGGLSDFRGAPIIDVHLAGASVTKTATILDVLRMTVCKVMLAYMKHGKTTLVKGNSGQKSTVTERNHRTLGIVSKNHNYCSTGDSRTEYSS